VRVLYSFPDRVGAPGIGSTAYQQVKALAAAGAEVLLHCTTLERELPPAVDVTETMRLFGRRIPHRALGISRSYRRHDAQVARALRRRDDVEVVHSWPRATLETAAAARATGTPLAREVPNTHTAHAFDVVAREHARIGVPVAADNSHVFSPATLAVEEAEYAAANALLVPSEYVYRSFVEKGVPSHKLSLQQYGFDPERFSAEGREDGSQPFTAAFVGRCEPRKGLHLALQAWIDSGAAESGRFVVCGSFVPGYREYLEPLLAHPSVEVLGFVPDPARVMRESDVLVFPSVEEGSALVTYEAQACGCVLVASDAAGARCENGVHGLIHAAGDLEALTADLRTVASDRDVLTGLRTASLARIDELTWTAAGRALLATYRRLTAL
jgi:glycosyltransferase involved in cell wall biosynthesis